MIELNDQILVIKLIRTDTTLDLSQKAEKNTVFRNAKSLGSVSNNNNIRRTTI